MESQKNLFPLSSRLIIYTDGGARGNPGPAAIGVVIGGSSAGGGSAFGGKKYGEYIGEATNNVAEYSALVFALKKAKALMGKKQAKETELECNMDSELLVKQLNGEYKIENKDLQSLWLEIWNLKMDFKKVYFRHIPREQNKEADKMVNKTLDNR